MIKKKKKKKTNNINILYNIHKLYIFTFNNILNYKIENK